LGKVVGYLAAAFLVFLGAVFLLASVYAISRLLVGTVLALVGVTIAFLTWRAGAAPASVKYEIETPGSLKLDSVKCPNCGAGLDPSKIELGAGAPWIKCVYCGKEFEVTEEPKW
jgi:DNA-directed RNA polymerase subunit RPC12/RpoP